jgi:hypothetical protein
MRRVRASATIKNAKGEKGKGHPWGTPQLTEKGALYLSPVDFDPPARGVGRVGAEGG